MQKRTCCCPITRSIHSRLSHKNKNIITVFAHLNKYIILSITLLKTPLVEACADPMSNNKGKKCSNSARIQTNPYVPSRPIYERRIGLTFRIRLHPKKPQQTCKHQMNLFFTGKSRQKTPAELVKSVKEALLSISSNPKNVEKVSCSPINRPSQHNQYK